MAAFTIDREKLPRRWEQPLIFVLSDGAQTVTAEITREGALEYIEAGRAGGGPVALAFQRREDFLQAVEAAVGAIEVHHLNDHGRVTLNWGDLYP
jgi:hypothetical protein